ncbi:MAG: hypothetical protein ABI411_19860 [Tahibacter sp.]
MHGWFTIPNIWVQLLLGFSIGGAAAWLFDAGCPPARSTIPLVLTASMIFDVIFLMSVASVNAGTFVPPDSLGFLMAVLPVWPAAIVIVGGSFWIVRRMRKLLDNYLNS